MIAKCKCIGIEVRHTRDYNTKAEVEKYYFHGIREDSNCLEGNATFTARIPDFILPLITVGNDYDVIFRSYQGYNTVEGVYLR